MTDCHTAIDYAHVLKDLTDIHFPCAKIIVLIQDNPQHSKQGVTLRVFPACSSATAG
jgi:hypothetical protein